MPLTASGPLADHVVAFARRDGNDEAVVIVPRLTARLAQTAEGAIDWKGTSLELDGRRYRSVLTGDAVDGGPLAVETLLRRFPVGLWVTTPAKS